MASQVFSLRGEDADFQLDAPIAARTAANWRGRNEGLGYGVWELTRRQAMGSRTNEPRYVVGVDLGQSRDPTAIAVVRRVEPVSSE